jgi:hypothetical protein
MLIENHELRGSAIGIIHKSLIIHFQRAKSFSRSTFAFSILLSWLAAVPLMQSEREKQQFCDKANRRAK